MAYAIPKQSTRLIILLMYVGVLCVANIVAFDQLPPISGGKGLWFYTGLASLLLGNLLVTPFYTKPVDAIAYSVAAGIALYAVHEWPQWETADRAAFLLALLYCAAVLLSAFLAIVLKDSPSQGLQKLSNSARIFADTFGNQKAVFSAVIFFAVFVFHRGSATETVVIILAWAITVAFKPAEILIGLWGKLRDIWKPGNSAVIIGDVIAYQMPGVALIRQRGSDSTPLGTVLLVKDTHAPPKIGISLDYVGRDEGMLLRTIEIDIPEELHGELVNISNSIPGGTVARIGTEIIAAEQTALIPALSNIKELIGIVAPETSIERLYFEVIRADNLEEGMLAEVFIGKERVLYQIVNGLTKEEIVHQKNTYGYVRAQARKIGIWSNTERKFHPAKWLPQLNSPVFLKTTDNYQTDASAIGYFPGTNYTVSIKSVSDLVTHNTAILGILGVGKSMLAIELVERMIAEGIKVICIDLADQYSKELLDFYNADDEQKKLDELCKVGQAGKTKVEKNVEEGGSIKAFAAAITKDISEFLDTKTSSKLKIFNPSKFEVWRQDSKPYNNTASMASLTPTEATHIISDAALRIAQEQGMTDKARVCLVYEEAHSLIPEWNSVVAEGDKSATSGTARAILQGRKYGMGCLLVTQRTANVTKTILNQCNTIFAMRTFDDTGKEFLSNYIGSDYADILPSLQERHAVFFGKASSCENPVLIRLNDKDDFRETFREVHPPTGTPATAKPPQQATVIHRHAGRKNEKKSS